MVEVDNKDMDALGQRARDASRVLANLSTETKNRALTNISDALIKRQDEILEANASDLKNAQSSGTNKAVFDRLQLTSERLAGIAEDVQKVISLPDPTVESFDAKQLPNGLNVSRRRVPLGVIGTVYESRPNITIDISVLCIKSGNSVILRGGKESALSNMVLSNLVRDGIGEAGIPPDAVQFIKSTDRSVVTKMLQMKNYIDLMIPRGGSDLVMRVSREATMPAITGGIGVCHIYIDKYADINKAVTITYNSKVSRPYVCNALDTVLIHSDVASTYLPIAVSRWNNSDVEVRCDSRALSILGKSYPSNVVSATNQDWGTEFLGLVVSVKIVDSIEGAFDHIEKYGSGHTDGIVTENHNVTTKFLGHVDSSVVVANASTRYNDGAELGLGAEVAISTSKFHARGPMGLRELTSYKWIVQGTGQIRE